MIEISIEIGMLKIFECEHLLVQQCVKLTLVGAPETGKILNGSGLRTILSQLLFTFLHKILCSSRNITFLNTYLQHT